MSDQQWRSSSSGGESSNGGARRSPGSRSGGAAARPVFPSTWAAMRYHFGPASIVVLAFLILVAVSEPARENLLGISSDSNTDFGEGLAEAERYLQTHYYLGAPSSEELLHAAMRGMADSVGDRYTVYFSPEDLAAFRTETSGNFKGIGVRIDLDGENRPTIFSVFPGSPAEKAGLRPGDRIMSIDGRDPKPAIDASENARDTFSNVIVDEWMKGPGGSSFNATVRHGGSDGSELGPAREVTVTRGDVHVSSVEIASMLANLTSDTIDPTLAAPAREHGIGYLRFEQFQRDSRAEVERAIDRLIEQGMKTLVFDLRGNPGGVLTEARDIAGLFLQPGQLISFTRGATPDADEEQVATRDANAGRFADLPLILLVDRGSASASEIVAGALRDYQRAILIGEQTFGKGLVQQAFLLGDEGKLGAIKITIARYFTPSGRCLQRDEETGYTGGIIPHVQLPIISAEVYQQIGQVRRVQSVYPPGEGHWIGIAAEYRPTTAEPFSDPHLAAAVQIIAGNTVAYSREGLEEVIDRMEAEIDVAPEEPAPGEEELVPEGAESTPDEPTDDE